MSAKMNTEVARILRDYDTDIDVFSEEMDAPRKLENGDIAYQHTVHFFDEEDGDLMSRHYVTISSTAPEGYWDAPSFDLEDRS